VVGANVAKALWGRGESIGKRLTLGGTTFFVVGESAPRKGAFFGENRQDSVIAIPLATARRLYPFAESTVFYIRAEPGRRDAARLEAEAILRRLRDLPAEAPNDFHLSTAEQIIAQFDQIAAVIALVTLALAAVSLGIGGIGIANVMIIAVTERTREIGVRRALGARRREVLRQFLLEAAMLSLAGGALIVPVAWLQDFTVLARASPRCRRSVGAGLRFLPHQDAGRSGPASRATDVGGGVRFPGSET
jgi:putative ABC transport system permease protein